MLMPWRNRPAIASPSVPGGLTPLLPGTLLLASHTHLLLQIRQQVGVPEAHWQSLYRSHFEAFADFVQQLPASEAHHHAVTGGLLLHGLEVCHRALALRRGVLLPRGASAEELAEKQDVWTYAVATAALLHDIGKPVCDQCIQTFDAAGSRLGDWDAFTGPIRHPVGYYQTTFRRGRRYRLHARIPPLLAHHLLPAVGLKWLASDADVFEAWLATISGGDHELSGELGKLIRSADSLSVASDLSGNEITRFSATAPKSLSERALTALRYLLEQGKLPLNKPGAAGWISDEAVWLVSKRVMDTLREHMLTEGQPGVPQRNDRLMDELQATGVFVANGDKAIWNATVQLGSWATALTLLRVPLSKLWPDADARPCAFDGQVIPDAAGVSVAADTAEPVHRPVPQAVTKPPTIDAGAIAELPQRMPVTDTEVADDVETRATAAEHPCCQQSEFLAWLRDGIVTGRLKTNAADARVHYVEEGLLLVSPAVFRDFAGVTGWEAAQKKLLKLRLHRKTAQDTNVWTYRVVGETKSGALLRGIVIAEPQAHLGIVVTRINPVLHRVTDAGKASSSLSCEVFPVETPAQANS